MAFFRDYFAAMLNNSYARGAILVGFFIYLSVAIWGVLQLQEGLERRRLARFDSYSVRFYDLEDRYFREYPYRISVSVYLNPHSLIHNFVIASTFYQVVFSGSLNYSSPKIQSDIELIMQRFENSTYIDSTFTESWLRDFLDYIHRSEEYAPIDISDEHKFIEHLTQARWRDQLFKKILFYTHHLFNKQRINNFITPQTYLSSGETHFTSDISLGPPNSKGLRRIEASRFLVQGHQIYNTEDEKKLLKEVREICHTTPYNVTVFNPYFIYFDQVRYESDFKCLNRRSTFLSKMNESSPRMGRAREGCQCGIDNYHQPIPDWRSNLFGSVLREVPVLLHCSLEPL